MNLLRQCTFLDRSKNTLVELEDLIEQKAINRKDQTEDDFFVHIILYFTANWLPDTSNHNINKKLKEFYRTEKDRKCFEIIFISLDKSKESFNEFLKENNYIRYALIFQEQDLKNQLCKYFNVNGMPFLSIVSLRVDRKGKIISCESTEKINMKHHFLADVCGEKFPWCENGGEDCKSSIFNNNTTANVAKSMNQLSVKDMSPWDMFSEIVYHLEPFNKGQMAHETKSISQLVSCAKFLFVLFGSSDSNFSRNILTSLIKFYEQFHVKHNFQVAYLSMNRISEAYKHLVGELKWYKLENADMKIKIVKYYCVKSVPKLLILDCVTGELLNDTARLAITEYFHKFCYEEKMNGGHSRSHHKKRSSSSSVKPHVSRAQSTAARNEEGAIAGTSFDLNRVDFDINFDLEMQDMYFDNSNNNSRQVRSKKKQQLEQQKASKSHSASPAMRTNKRRRLDLGLVNQLCENLVDVSTGERVVSSECEEDSSRNKYYILYFCSNFTTSNSSLYENVLRFAYAMKEKMDDCEIKIVLVSSDHHQEDYTMLLDKYKTKDPMLGSNLALDFNFKQIKEALYLKLRVMGIPWFSLINASNGEIMCENLKIFILNSQLREIIF